jgi:syntaxin 6
MLDEFGNELENTDSKLDTTMKKVAKVLHISNGKLESSPFSSFNVFMN